MVNLKIEDSLKKLRKINGLLNDVFSDEVNQLENLYNDNIFKVTIIGEFSVGKSTFLNALVKKRILFSDFDEATGIVTTIENNKKNMAIINFQDGNIKKMDIGTKEDYNELKTYLDINNKEKNKVTSVNVKYDFDGVDNEIIFVDTPGLQGISDEQLKITKDAIKEANATIILINPKGLNENELSLICGRNKDFGKLRTKEIFLLVNKIGIIYDNNPKEEADKKIENVLNEVNNKLVLNGAKDVKIFAIDGLDYLHAFDNELYSEFIESKKGTSYKVLSQNEYLERSRYEIFKKYLFEFLEKGNRQKAFEDDIKEKISIFLEELEEVITKDKSINKNNSSDNFSRYDKEKEFLIENRRRFINSLKREVSNLSNEFMKSINSETKEFVKAYVKNGGELVKTIEKEINKKNINNIEDKVKEILDQINKKILDEIKDISINMNLFYNNMNLVLNEKFNIEFQKIFKKNSDIKFSLVQQNVNLDFKFNSTKYSKKYDEDIDDIMREINENTRDLIDIEIEFVKSKLSMYEKDNLDVERELERAYKNYNNLKYNFGVRPSPKQKYKTVKRTRKKWLIFNDDYYEDVPDGIDFSDCNIWDEKVKALQECFEKDEAKIYKKKDANNKNIIDCKIQIQKAEAISEKIIELKKTIKSLQDQAKKNIENNMERYVDGKKNDIYILAKKYMDDNGNLLMRTIEKVIDTNNSDIKKVVEEESTKYLKAYEIKIEENIEKIKKEISNKNISDAELINLINELRGHSKK